MEQENHIQTDIPAESMNLSQLISDTRELSEILAKRFKHQKIYLMGHSWGSFLGILTAYKYPELYHAYFGIGQVCFQYKGEKISYEWAKNQANKLNNTDAIEALSAISFPDSTASLDKWGRFYDDRTKLGKSIGWRYNTRNDRNVASR